ncbi:hypothetical protein AMTRI_Chr08g164310 [Amborella trichopoda]
MSQESRNKSRSIRNTHDFLCFFRFIDSRRLKPSRKQPDSSSSGCLSEASLIESCLAVERTSCTNGASIPCMTCFKVIQSSCSSSR